VDLIGWVIPIVDLSISDGYNSHWIASRSAKVPGRKEENERADLLGHVTVDPLSRREIPGMGWQQCSRS